MNADERVVFDPDDEDVKARLQDMVGTTDLVARKTSLGLHATMATDERPRDAIPIDEVRKEGRCETCDAPLPDTVVVAHLHTTKPIAHPPKVGRHEAHAGLFYMFCYCSRDCRLQDERPEEVATHFAALTFVVLERHDVQCQVCGNDIDDTDIAKLAFIEEGRLLCSMCYQGYQGFTPADFDPGDYPALGEQFLANGQLWQAVAEQGSGDNRILEAKRISR